MTEPKTCQLEKENAALKAENKAWKKAAAALIGGLAKTAMDTWFSCPGAGKDGDCQVIPMVHLQWPETSDHYCDSCAQLHLDGERFLGAPQSTASLPHAAPLRALRALLEAP